MLRPRRRFVIFATSAITSTLAVTLGTPSAQPQPSALGERDFRVEWDLRQTARGSAIVGYVYNTGGLAAARVSVLVQGLDAADRPVNSTIGYVLGTVPAFNRTYFEMRVPDATSYRVSVLSFEWLKGGGAGGGM